LDWRVLQWLGRISYPIYLLNVPVQFGCAMLAAPLAHGDEALFTRLWLPLADIMPVLAAVVLHKMVEVPGMRPEARTRWMASARGASQ
jgi:peptidoglycan/LPS O-acetylase OafA/YrhL